MFRWSLAVIVEVAVSAVVPQCCAESVTLVPAKDNTLVQYTPGVSTIYRSNGAGDIFVGRTNQDGLGPAEISIRRGLIQFDVEGAVPRRSKRLPGDEIPRRRSGAEVPVRFTLTTS